MKFKDLLNEKFHDGFKHNGKYREIYVNPTKQEIQTVARESSFGSVRFGVEDKPNPKIYAWNGMVIHEHIPKSVAKFDFGFYYEGGDVVMHDSAPTPDQKDWAKVKNKKAIMKKIRTILPKVKTLITWEHFKDIKKYGELEVDLRTGKETRIDNQDNWF